MDARIKLGQAWTSYLHYNFTCLFTLPSNDSTYLLTGDYCGEPGLNQTSGPCDAGYYCPPGQNVSNQAGM